MMIILHNKVKLYRNNFHVYAVKGIIEQNTIYFNREYIPCKKEHIVLIILQCCDMLD